MERKSPTRLPLQDTHPAEPEVPVKALPFTQVPGKTGVPSRRGPAPQPHLVRTVAASGLVTD